MNIFRRYEYLDRLFFSRRFEVEKILNLNVPLKYFLRSIWIDSDQIKRLDIDLQMASNMKFIGGVLGANVGVILALMLYSSLSFLLLPFVVLLSMYFGYSVFDFYVLDRNRYMDFRIAAEIPAFLDAISAEVSANPELGVIHAIKLVSGSLDSLLVDRINNVLKISHVVDSRKVLEMIQSDLRSSDIDELVRIAKISQRYGVNPAPAVKQLSERTHEHWLLRGKELGQKSSGALLIPLILFFLPVTTMVILLPSILGFLNN